MIKQEQMNDENQNQKKNLTAVNNEWRAKGKLQKVF